MNRNSKTSKNKSKTHWKFKKFINSINQ